MNGKRTYILQNAFAFAPFLVRLIKCFSPCSSLIANVCDPTRLFVLASEMGLVCRWCVSQKVKQLFAKCGACSSMNDAWWSKFYRARSIEIDARSLMFHCSIICDGRKLCRLMELNYIDAKAMCSLWEPISSQGRNWYTHIFWELNHIIRLPLIFSLNDKGMC